MMQDIIAVLPDSIANQIAAGEVIQRPASVVKELMENAVDAGATRIDLLIKDAGRTLIQVLDDGKGMSPLDARLCWERHATSKIRKTEDLFSIRSFGFRGEALASIAAVAQVEMKTRPQHTETATLVQVEGSDFKKQETVVAPYGTSISVKNLFFNIPARRNFLKSNAVEMKHIVDDFIRVALPNPQISFTLTHGDNELFRLPGGTQKKRISELLSVKETELFEGEELSSVADYRVFLGSPKLARKTRGDQYFILNGRFIKDPYLNHALVTVYKDYLPEDTFPTYVVFLDIDPSKVDINVHPTKTEVKFEDERILYQLLKSVVKKVLAQNHLGQFQSDIFDNTSFSGFLGNESKGPEFPTEPKVNVNPSYNPFHSDGQNQRQKKNLFHWESLYQGMESKEDRKAEEASSLLIPGIEKPAEKKARQEVFVSGQLLQVFNSYIVADRGQEFWVIDQEKAHQRVLFERICENIRHQQSASQQLLFPRVIELAAREAALMEDILEEIRHLGFDISSFGNQSFIINGVPAGADKTEARELLEGLLEEYKSSSGIDIHDKRTALARALARKSSIRKGKVLTAIEMTELLNDWINCEEPGVSPDGKITFLRYDEQNLSKLFNF